MTRRKVDNNLLDNHVNEEVIEESTVLYDDPFVKPTQNIRQVLADTALAHLRTEYRIAKNRLTPKDGSEPSDSLIQFVESQHKRMQQIAQIIRALASEN